MISTEGVFMPMYLGRLGNSSSSPKLTRPGDLTKKTKQQIYNIFIHCICLSVLVRNNISWLALVEDVTHPLIG